MMCDDPERPSLSRLQMELPSGRLASSTTGGATRTNLLIKNGQVIDPASEGRVYTIY